MPVYRRLPARLHIIEQRQQHADAGESDPHEPLEHGKPLVHVTLHVLETPVDLFEASIHLFKPLINLLEALVHMNKNLLYPFLYRAQPFLDPDYPFYQSQLTPLFEFAEHFRQYLSHRLFQSLIFLFARSHYFLSHIRLPGIFYLYTGGRHRRCFKEMGFLH